MLTDQATSDLFSRHAGNARKDGVVFRRNLENGSNLIDEFNSGTKPGSLEEEPGLFKLQRRGWSSERPGSFREGFPNPRVDILRVQDGLRP